MTRNSATKKKEREKEKVDKDNALVAVHTLSYRASQFRRRVPSLSIVSASYWRTVTKPRFEFEFEEGREG